MHSNKDEETMRQQMQNERKCVPKKVSRPPGTPRILPPRPLPPGRPLGGLGGLAPLNDTSRCYFEVRGGDEAIFSRRIRSARRGDEEHPKRFLVEPEVIFS